MSMKQYVRYKMNFDSKFTHASLCLMGLSFFFRIFYYLGLGYAFQGGVGQWLLCVILPLLAGGAYVLLGVMKRGTATLYGVLGLALLLLMAVTSCFSGSVLRSVLGLVAYGFSGILFLASAGGYVPDKTPVSVLIGLCLGLRVLLFDLYGLSLVQWILELSSLAMLLSLLLLPCGLRRKRKKAPHKAQIPPMNSSAAE